MRCGGWWQPSRLPWQCGARQAGTKAGGEGGGRRWKVAVTTPPPVCPVSPVPVPSTNPNQEEVLQ